MIGKRDKIMGKTLLEKMFYKPEYITAILQLPQDLEGAIATINTDATLKKRYNFILAFYIKKEVMEKEIVKIREALVSDGLLWVAYPKGKGLQTDLNRDILHTALKKYQLEGVSLVSLGDTWSAMRFKKQ